MKTYLLFPILGAAAMLTACSPVAPSGQANVIDFHQNRLGDLQVINAFDACVTEGIERDRMAREMATRQIPVECKDTGRM